jgi:uncharacterized protein YndB with AHSA1/START domain
VPNTETVDAVEVEVRIAATPETVFDFFTWGWEGGEPLTRPGTSRVEVLLAADGDGTRLRLLHHDLPTAESAGKHRLGWRHYLDRLAVVGGGGDPGPDDYPEAR